MENSQILLETKLVSEITGTFYVPSYQRGYRWGEDEVLRLLNDVYLNGAINKESGQNRKYCLQPVVVRKNSEAYELIDGQQRLTTLYLIKMVILAKKEGVTDGFSELFRGFLPRQFFSVLGMAIGYLAALYLIGFYPATLIFMILVLWFMNIRPRTIAITTAAILALVFVTFNVVLKVSLLRGLVFELLF